MTDKPWNSYAHPTNQEMQLYNLLRAMVRNDDLKIPPMVASQMHNIINYLEMKYPYSFTLPNGAK